MEADTAVNVPAPQRVPDSRLPGAEVDEQKKSASNSEETSVYALWPVFAWIFIAITVAAFAFTYGPQRTLKFVLRTIMPEKPEPWHIVVMVAIGVALLVCCLPVLPLLPFPTVILGFWHGFTIVFMIQVLAAALSLCIGRYVAQRRVRAFLESKAYHRSMRWLHILEKEEESMLLLLLFRFLPIPLFARNYAPSILSVPIPRIIMSTVPQGLFSAFANAVVGTALHGPAQDLRDGHEITFETPKWQEALGIAVALIAFALFTWIAYRAYSRKLKEEEEETGIPVATLRSKGAEEGATTTQYGASLLLSSLRTSGS